MHRSHRAGRGIGLFHLPQNLRLTHNHRVQTRGHAKQVPDRIAFAVFIKVRLVVRWIQLKVVAEKGTQVHHTIFRLRQHFHPVTGRQDDPFIHARMPRQALQCLGQSRLGDGQSLPHLDRRRLVVHPDELKLHDWTNP